MGGYIAEALYHIWSDVISFNLTSLSSLASLYALLSSYLFSREFLVGV